MKLTGAQILLECLKKENVELMFGYPGAVILDIHDNLPASGIEHILVRHEQAAVHAADGYARASGKVGVCLVTSGPGATNTVTGLATANADSIPIVVFSGQVPTALIGNDAFQEVDIVGITRSCTKHNYLVKDVKELVKIVRQAFYLAKSGRPGPVLVDLPRDVLTAKAEFNYPEEPVRMRTYNPTCKPNLNQLKKAMDVLFKAEKPVFLVGGGVIMSGAEEELTKLALSMNAPVTATLMGLGAFPGNDSLWLGMLGMHGTFAANQAISQADVLLAIGVRFDDRVTGRIAAFAAKAKIIHTDIDPTSIRKNVQVDYPIVCDCKEAIAVIQETFTAKQNKETWQEKLKPWHKQIEDWKNKQPISYTKSKDVLKPQEVIEAVYEITQGNAIIATEVGQHQMWTAQFYKFTETSKLLSSGGLGTMGYGLPAAIGAQFACPDRLVIDIAGDGSIQMNIQELIVAVSNNLPVKIVILNNNYLGMIRQLQEFFYDKRYFSIDMQAQPDFVKLAESYGAEGYRVTKPEELIPVLQKAFASDKTAIVDVQVAREESVYPMVPAGAALNEMLLA